MTTCQRSTGLLFLEGQLAAGDEQAYAEHIEQCDRCRHWLEQDAGDDLSWVLAQELAGQEGLTTDPGGRAARVACADGIDSDESPPMQVALQIAPYLSPSDDPSMMGRVGPYEIVGVIGRGGMGIVLKGFERSLNRNVAIKLLDPSLASLGSARVRFSREAKAMAAVSDAHVVPIFAVDQHRELPYFAMEYVVGETLEQRLRRDGPLGVSSVVRVALQVAEALAAAHCQGLVHRDIKPGNILLDRGTDRVQVADFGLARIASDVSQTHSAIVAGTPQYMSPEQVRGAACDGRSDLFSLGSVMYAMCTGHAPFRADSIYGTMQRIAHDAPRSLREQNAEVPRWLENFIWRLLSKDPDDRFGSADEVARVLRGELNHMLNPTQVKQPPRVWARKQKSPARGRSPTVWITAATLLLAVTVFAATRLSTPDPSSSPSSKPSGAGVRPTIPSLDDTSVPDLVPLWDVDGTRETRERLDALQQGLQTDLQNLDSWRQDVDLLRQQMTHFSQEPF